MTEELDTTPVFPEADSYGRDNDGYFPRIIWKFPGPDGKTTLSPKIVCLFEAGVLSPFEGGTVDYDVPAFTGRPAAECTYLEINPHVPILKGRALVD